MITQQPLGWLAPFPGRSPAGWQEITPGDDDLTAPEGLTSGAMTPTQARVLERAAVSPGVYEPGTCHDPGHTPWWGPAQLPRRHLASALTVLRREWVVGLFGLSAIFAAVTALV